MRPKNLDARNAALKAYQENPKATLKKLSHITGLTVGMLSYHLHKMHKEGVVIFKRKRGRPLPSEVIDPKKSASGQQGKGADAFSPKERKNATTEAENLEAAVKIGKERDRLGKLISSTNVVMHSPVRLSGARKLG